MTSLTHHDCDDEDQCKSMHIFCATDWECLCSQWTSPVSVVHCGSRAQDNIVDYHIEVKLFDTIASLGAILWLPRLLPRVNGAEIFDETVRGDDYPELKNAKKLHHVEREPFIRGFKRAVDLPLPTASVFGNHEDQPSLLDSEPGRLLVKQYLDVEFFRLADIAVLMHAYLDQMWPPCAIGEPSRTLRWRSHCSGCTTA